MAGFLRALLSVGAGAALLGAAGPAAAQCPSHPEEGRFGESYTGGHGFDGDEPEDFTHYLDDDGDGVCDFEGDADGDGRCDELACRAVVAWDAERGVHPNGVYPDCMLVRYEDGTTGTQVIRQIGHSHWEYTHLQDDELGQGEEKDYATLTQAMQTDYENGDSDGTATREALDQAIRFALREPLRFDRFLRPSANPSGRYWQVDEWIGPAGAGFALPLLTWKERFFACASEDGTSACARVNGVPAFGGYWSDHAEQFRYQADCGDGFLDDPEPELDDPVDPDGRDNRCGVLFVECF